MATFRKVPIITGGLGGVLAGVAMGFLLETSDRSTTAGWLLATLHKPVEAVLGWMATMFYPHNHDQAIVFILPVLLAYWCLIGVLLGVAYGLVFKKGATTEERT